MKIDSILKEYNQGVSFEFFPPKTEKGIESLQKTAAVLSAYKPLYVSMTYGAGGSTQERTKEAVRMFQERADLVVMPHLTCIGARGARIAALLDEYKEKGIKNIMALRGDAPQLDVAFDSSIQEFRYGRDLVEFIKQRYSGFCVGIAVYPEGHIETTSLAQDTDYTRQKVSAGADFAVTQMFFDNSHYYSLLDRMEKAGINIPVLPGILPLTDVAKVKQFASICRTTIPEHIEEKMGRFKENPDEMAKAGIDFTIEQCRDLIKNGIKQIHFFTLNKPAVMRRILDAIS
ncbi:MAG: methylenetetrahydrofolate reductase [NAD(P)H] [Candidatus Omnitrophota bacterium]|nr:MAG: methylenetetrahydrofolate reductase [NAD(P)H] [Candidatus Omnitrophota bacterium]